MPQPGASDSGLRFASDLRRIRESKGMTLDYLHNETKIPKNLLQSFEGTGLFDHPMFNRVYLRSFVRNYADVLGLNADVALQSLDEALDGRYRGRLGVEYLGEKPEYVETPATEHGTSAPPAGVEKPAESAVRKPGQPVKRSIHYAETPVTAPPVSPAVPETPYRSPESEWTSQSPPPTSRSPYTYEEPERRGVMPWILTGAVVIVLAALGWYLFKPSVPEETGLMEEDTSTTQSTLAPEEPVLDSTAEAPVATLPDTLRLTIQAANDKVEKIQVTVDDDLRRPYWIERGESRSFVFKDRVILERQLNKINLVVNGSNYPVAATDSLGRLIITRSGLARSNR